MHVPEVLIHSAWFGEAPIPSLFKRCMTTWSAFDVSLVTNHLDWRAVPYVAEAVEAGNWAAVSDYVRLSLLWQFGGAWLDVDVEIVRPTDFATIAFAVHETKKLVVGMEDEQWCCNAVILAPARHPTIGHLLDQYNAMHYSDTFNGTVTGATLLTDAVQMTEEDLVQVVRPDVFYPWHWRDKHRTEPWKRDRMTTHTVCAHHWAGSWVK